MHPAERLGQAFMQAHPQQAAEILEDTPVRTAADFLYRLPTEAAARLITTMLGVPAARCLEALPTDAATALLGQVPLRQSLELLRRLPPGVRDKLLGALPDQHRRSLRRALKGGSRLVGNLVDTRVLALPADTRVERAVRLLANHEIAAECHLYVLRDDARLLGTVPVRDLFGAHDHALLGSIARHNLPAVPANATVAGVLNHPGWKRYAVLPVVDPQGVFTGVLRRTQLDDSAREPGRPGHGGGLALTLAVLEAYVTASHALLATLSGQASQRRKP